jgi:hypothetical protein
MAGRILKKNKVGGLTLHNFRSSYKATVIKRVWCWPDGNRMGNPEIKFSHLSSVDFQRDSRDNVMERIVFSINGAETTKFPMQKNEAGTTPHSTYEY